MVTDLYSAATPASCAGKQCVSTAGREDISPSSACFYKHWKTPADAQLLFNAVLHKDNHFLVEHPTGRQALHRWRESRDGLEGEGWPLFAWGVRSPRWILASRFPQSSTENACWTCILWITIKPNVCIFVAMKLEMKFLQEYLLLETFLLLLGSMCWTRAVWWAGVTHRELVERRHPWRGRRISGPACLDQDLLQDCDVSTLCINSTDSQGAQPSS